MNVDFTQFRALPNEFYGDSFRWFFGVVVNVNDPLKVGRVRVRIFGVHNESLLEVPEESLPWAMTVTPPNEDGVSGLGRTLGIKPGAYVVGFFIDGVQSQVPIVLGSMPRFDRATQGQTGAGSDQPFSSTTGSANSPINSVAAEAAARAGAKSGAFYDPSGAVGSSNTEKAYNFFISTKLFSPVQSAAICGNLIKESNMNPGITSSFAGENSFGIAQWNPGVGRKQMLQAFADARGLDYGAIETHLQFLVWEFSESAPGYYKFGLFTSTNDISKCTEIFCSRYENPAAAYADIPGRIKAAKQVFDTYNFV
jgi:hypothetical protein